MAIEITPRVKLKLPIWIISLGVLTILLVIAFLGSYLYLFISINSMSKQIEEKQPILAPLEENIRNKEEELIPLSEKIDSFAKLIQGHKKSLNIFNFLEQICLPNVWFSDFDFSSKAGEVTVSGETDNFVSLEQQIIILRQEPFVKNLSISEASISEEGKVVFIFLITFDPQVFD